MVLVGGGLLLLRRVVLIRMQALLDELMRLRLLALLGLLTLVRVPVFRR
jgi:hypothetical protein